MKHTTRLLNAYKLAQRKGTGRQSKATRGGQAFERGAFALFSKHPNVKQVETQVFNSDVDEFSNIDLVITTKSNRKVYVPMAKDLWIGTSQQDRLQAVYYKTRLMTRRTKYAYLCLSDFNDFLSKSYRESARRGPTLQATVATLAAEQRLHNADTLWDYISTL